MNAEKALRDRIRTASGFFREVINLADEQGWTYKAKESGVLFFAPSSVARVGFGRVFVTDPGNDSGRQRIVRMNLTKAGLRFEPAKPAPLKGKVSMTSTSSTTPKATPTPHQPQSEDEFDLITAKINTVVQLLSDIEVHMKSIRQKNEKLQSLRELLKGI